MHMERRLNAHMGAEERMHDKEGDRRNVTWQNNKKSAAFFVRIFFSNLTQPGRFDVYDKAAAKEEGGACVGAERATQKDHRDHKHQTL